MAINPRRGFLQKITAATIAYPILTHAAAACTSTSKKPYDGPLLRVAIMGLGSYGTRVADAMQECTKAKLVGAISGTPSKIKDWQSRHQSFPVLLSRSPPLASHK